MLKSCGFSSFVEKKTIPIKEQSNTIILYKVKLNTLYTGTHSIYLERVSFNSPRVSSSRSSSPTLPRQNTFLQDVQLQSFVNGTTIRIYDIQENNLDINTLYSYSELKKKELKSIDPDIPDYACDCLVYAYEFIEFLKEHGIKYPISELFILYNAPELENAYWNGYYLTFGNGVTNRSRALVSPAIVGHELFHSVIQHSINLTYYGESGALNESYADIFGVMFEFWLEQKKRGIGYELGSELFFDMHSMRSFKDPNKCNQPVSLRDPLFYRGSQDNGGVHINSSLANHCFYRMQLVTNREVVFDIFLKVFFKLKSNSTFNDFKRILLSYCSDKDCLSNHNLEYVNIINEIF